MPKCITCKVTYIIIINNIIISVNFTIAANHQYVSFKFGLIEVGWFISLDHLFGKVRNKILLFHNQYYVVSLRRFVLYVSIHVYLFVIRPTKMTLLH